MDLHRVSWERKRLSLQDVFDKTKCPCIIKVACGFHGDSPCQTASTDDILFVDSKTSHTKVMVRDTASRRFFSLPLDTNDYMFRCPNADSEQPRSLAHVVKFFKPPCRVQVVGGGTLHSIVQPQTAFRFTMLDIIELYEEKLLSVHPVLHGALHDDSAIWPTYLDMKVVVAKQPSPKSQRNTWKQLMADFSREVAEVMKRKTTSTEDAITGITGYGTSDVTAYEGIYETLEPSMYLSLSRDKGGHANIHTYEELTVDNQKNSPRKTPSALAKQDETGIAPEVPQQSSARQRYTASSPTECTDGRTTKGPMSGRIHFIEDIPRNINDLSISDVANCLHLLNMSEYVEIFQQNQINGMLLTSLEEEMFHEDLGVSKMNARKLRLFATGAWRPKTKK